MSKFEIAKQVKQLIVTVVILATAMFISTLQVAAQTLEDLFTQRAKFVVEDNRDQNFMRFLSTFKVGNELFAYYISYTNGKHTVSLAKSFDGGANFVDYGLVLNAGERGWDDGMRSFPGVWRDGGMWYMVYEGSGSGSPGDIGLATSSDGIIWAVDPQPILTHQHSGWERQNIGTPSLWKEGSTWYLFYHGYGASSDGTDDVQIGAAFGTDIRHLQRYSGNPILRTSRSGFDSGTLGKRSIIRENGWYYMVYEVSTEISGGSYGNSRWSSGVARGRSLFGPWEKYPVPALPVTNQGFGYDGPEWIRTPDGKLHLCFRNSRNGTGRATLIYDTSALTFQAESHLQHLIGRKEADGWSATTRDDSSGFLAYGPYTTLIPAGQRVATFRLLIDNNSANNDRVVTLDIYDATAKHVLAQRDINRRDFLNANQYQDFAVVFDSPSANRLEFRTYWHDRAYIRQDSVVIR